MARKTKCCRFGVMAAAIAAAMMVCTATAEVVENVPQDEVDFIGYVEATGSQYVDTGVTGRSGTRIEADFVLNGSHPFLLGTKSADGSKFVAWKIDNWLMFSLYLPDYENGWWGKVPVSANTFYHLVSEISTAGAITGSFNNGATSEWHKTNWYKEHTSADNEPLGACDTGSTFYLFQLNDGGKPTSSANQWFAGRLKQMKIWQTAAYDSGDGYTLVRDFRPCRHQGRVGLYDAVNGSVYFSDSRDSAGNPIDLVAPADTEPDAFLEYVKATGAQFVDTGVIGRSGTRIDADLSVQKGGSRQYCMFMGSRSADHDFFAWQVYDRYMCFRYLPIPSNFPNGRGGDSWWAGVGGGGMFATDARHRMVAGVSPSGTMTMNYDGSDYNVLEWSNWNDIYPATDLGALDTGLPMYLFALNDRGVPAELNSPSTLYSLKIEQYDASAGEYVTVRDYKPCLKNNRAGLYDAVTGKIHYPVCGDFVAAPVGETLRRHVEWVESDGALYVDTGVIGRSGTRMEADFCSLTGGGTLLGTHASARTFFDWDLSQNYMCFRYLPVPADFPRNPGGNSWWYLDCGKIFTAGARWLLASDVSANGTISMSVDGVRYGMREWYNTDRFAENLGALDTKRSMYLFSTNTSDDGEKRTTRIRLFGLKIWQDGALVRDFRPCRIGAGSTALWDEVTQRFFFGQGGNLAADVDVKPATAKWKGAAAPASAADLSNAANWTCYSPDRTEIEGAVPTPQTTVVVSDENIGLLSTPPTVKIPRWGAVRIEASQTLSSDADWTALGAVQIGGGATVDLNGHSLRVASLRAAPAAQVVNGGAAASLVASVADPAFGAVEGLSLGAGVTLASDGTGTLEAAASMQVAHGLSVDAGTFVAHGLATAGSVAIADGAKASGIVLSDGATLAVGGRTTALEAGQVSFAADAAVKISAAGRSFHGNDGKGEKILAWDAVPEGVTFAFDAASGKGGKLVLNDDGLYAFPRPGFIVLIK